MADGLLGLWVFTHREIAQRLMDTFTGLKFKELAWFENPREKTLKNGKPRARRAKWLPEREVDLVYLYPTTILTPEIRLLPKLTFSPSQGWMPGV